MPVNYKKLDNPAWYALKETHTGFAIGKDELKRYDPSVVLFAGFSSANNNVAAQLDAVINPDESFFLFDPLPVLPQNYLIETVVECLQMVCDSPLPVPVTAHIIELDETNSNEMFDLMNDVFPGYYLPGTSRLGTYAGIFHNDKLVAMAGERLRMEGFTEVSAVVTHPAYTGRRYAQQLICYLNKKHTAAGIIPFLHTRSNNERAISIYELLGYKKRRLINVTKIKRIS